MRFQNLFQVAVIVVGFLVTSPLKATDSPEADVALLVSQRRCENEIKYLRTIANGCAADPSLEERKNKNLIVNFHTRKEGYISKVLTLEDWDISFEGWGLKRGFMPRLVVDTAADPSVNGLLPVCFDIRPHDAEYNLNFRAIYTSSSDDTFTGNLLYAVKMHPSKRSRQFRLGIPQQVTYEAVEGGPLLLNSASMRMWPEFPMESRKLEFEVSGYPDSLITFRPVRFPSPGIDLRVPFSGLRVTHDEGSRTIRIEEIDGAS